MHCIVKVGLTPGLCLSQNYCCWKWLVIYLPNRKGTRTIMETMNVVGPPNSSPGPILGFFMQQHKVSGHTYIYLIGRGKTLVSPLQIRFFALQTHLHNLVIYSGGQVTSKKWRSYVTSVTCKNNSVLIIRYPFFHCNASVTVISYWYLKCNKVVTGY